MIAIPFSCSQEGNFLDTNESFYRQDTCTENTGHTYELYIPGNARACSQLPLIIILDPHGNGKSAIERFIPASENYKCMLAASNYVKNNFNGYLDEISLLLNDIQEKYPTNGKIFVAGFSGGARMALSFGQRNIVNGVIACGALATRNQIITIRAPVYAMTGMQDFNFIETAQYIFQPENAPGNLNIELTDELHEWPSPNELNNAVAYMILSDDVGNRKCMNVQKVTHELTEKRKKEIENLKKKGNFLSAMLITKNMAHLHNEEIVNHFQPMLNSLEFSPELNEELNRLRESIRFELSVREAYMNALLTENLPWWKNEINSLNSNIKKDRDHFRNLAYKRIKAFLGIMCYTVTGKTIRSGDMKNAEKLLAVYRFLEPTNPDMFYFHALYFKKKGNLNTAGEFLQKAIDAGFSDRELIEQIDL
jgi:hypothetical protein